MKLGTFSQQPRERLPYSISYTDALSANDNVVAATATVFPEGPVIDIEVLDPRVRFFFTGGLSGTTYKVTVLTTTNDGSIFEDEVIIKVKEL